MAIHFKSKTCFTCKKMLICISGDWYELHASVKCDKENDKSNVMEVNVDVKTEAYDYGFGDERSVKSETFDDKSDDSRTDNIFEESPISYQNLIEVKSLPELITRVESPRTVPRKPRNAPKIKAKNDIFETKNEEKSSKPPRKKRKKVTYKATFLDHRPKASCICDICKKTLGTFSSLRNHMLNLHCVGKRSGRVSCDECGQTFSTPGNLNSHKKIHLKCKAYVCTYCGRGFNQVNVIKCLMNKF